MLGTPLCRRPTTGTGGGRRRLVVVLGLPPAGPEEEVEGWKKELRVHLSLHILCLCLIFLSFALFPRRLSGLASDSSPLLL